MNVQPMSWTFPDIIIHWLKCSITIEGWCSKFVYVYKFSLNIFKYLTRSRNKYLILSKHVLEHPHHRGNLYHIHTNTTAMYLCTHYQPNVSYEYFHYIHYNNRSSNNTIISNVRTFCIRTLRPSSVHKYICNMCWWPMLYRWLHSLVGIMYFVYIRL